MRAYVALIDNRSNPITVSSDNINSMILKKNELERIIPQTTDSNISNKLKVQLDRLMEDIKIYFIHFTT